MKKETVLRIILIVLFITAIVFAVLNYGFLIYIPAAIPFSCSTLFACFATLTIMEKDRQNLKHSKFIAIFSFTLTLITLIVGIIDLCS